MCACIPALGLDKICASVIAITLCAVGIAIAALFLRKARRKKSVGEDIDPVYETVGPKPPPVQDIPQVDSHFIMSSSGAYGVKPEQQLPDVMTQNILYESDLNGVVLPAELS